MAAIPDVDAIELSLLKYKEDLSSVLSYITTDVNQEKEWLSILEKVYNHLSLIACKDQLIKQKILLPKLVIQNFDDEQIWQQIELINIILTKNIQFEINKKLTEKSSGKNSNPEKDTTPSEEISSESIIDENEQEIGGYNSESDSGSANEVLDENPQFDLGDMDKFCDEIEKQDEEKNSDESDEEVTRNIFGKHACDDEIEDDLGESNLEKDLKKINTKIAANEKQALEAKPWKMLGESSQRDRGTNALLEEHIQFDHGVRAAPEITLDTSKKIEKLIIERIRIKLYDDVERKEKPSGKDLMKQQELPLNQEKSKLSLAEVYEKEYIESLDNPHVTEKEDIDEKEESIKADLGHLFRKLEAMSNFNYTPKGLKDEIKVIVNTPTISMEEAMPTAVSDRQVLAPAEIKPKQREELRTAVEDSRTDKKRKRKKIKKSQSIKAHDQEVKKLKLDRKNGSKKVTSKKDAISLVSEEVKQGISLAKKSSEKVNSSFFSKLQESIDTKKSNKISHSKKVSKGKTNRFDN